MAFSPSSILDFLLRFPPTRCYRVALSGGLDSTVLLHALAGLRAELPGADQAALSKLPGV